MKYVFKILDVRNKNEYNESYVVIVKKVLKVNFNLVIKYMYQKIVIELLFNLEIIYSVINVYIVVKYKKKLFKFFICISFFVNLYKLVYFQSIRLFQQFKFDNIYIFRENFFNFYMQNEEGYFVVFYDVELECKQNIVVYDSNILIFRELEGRYFM